MDSLTQLSLGATFGLALGGKKLGNKAALRGGFLGTIPDLDVFIGPWLYSNPIDAEIFHRGCTHSFFFAFLAAPICGYLISKIHKDDNFKLRTLISFVALSTHSLLDWFTGYGTQLLYPFIQDRYALDSIFIVDPVYTLPLLTLLIIGMSHSAKIKKSLFAWIGISISCLYLLWSFGAKAIATEHISTTLPAQTNLLKVSPAPFNTILRKALAEDTENYYFSRYSILDTNPPTQRYEVPKQHSLLDQYTNNQDIQKIITRRSPLTVAQLDENTLRLNIARYGKLLARDNFEEKDFMFSYTIQGTGDAATINSARDGGGNGPGMENGWGEKLWERILGE